MTANTYIRNRRLSLAGKEIVEPIRNLRPEGKRDQQISMYPMDYEEFLWALGDNSTMQLLKKVYELKKPLGEQMNRKLIRNFRGIF